MIRRDLDRFRLDADIVVVVENDAGDQVRVRAAGVEQHARVDVVGGVDGGEMSLVGFGTSRSPARECRSRSCCARGPG